MVVPVASQLEIVHVGMLACWRVSVLLPVACTGVLGHQPGLNLTSSHAVPLHVGAFTRLTDLTTYGYASASTLGAAPKFTTATSGEHA